MPRIQCSALTTRGAQCKQEKELEAGPYWCGKWKGHDAPVTTPVITAPGITAPSTATVVAGPYTAAGDTSAPGTAAVVASPDTTAVVTAPDTAAGDTTATFAGLGTAPAVAAPIVVASVDVEPSDSIGNEAWPTINVYTLNIDRMIVTSTDSDKQEAANTAYANLATFINDNSMAIVVLTEILSRSSADRISQELETKGLDYTSDVDELVRSEFIGFYYPASRYERVGELISSDVGKYVVTTLRDKISNLKFGICGVHLKRGKSIDLLKLLTEEATWRNQPMIVAGDFNNTPGFITEHLQGFEVVTTEPTSLAKKNQPRCIDNVAYRSSDGKAFTLLTSSVLEVDGFNSHKAVKAAFTISVKCDGSAHLAAVEDIRITAPAENPARGRTESEARSRTEGEDVYARVQPQIQQEYRTSDYSCSYDSDSDIDSEVGSRKADIDNVSDDTSVEETKSDEGLRGAIAPLCLQRERLRL